MGAKESNRIFMRSYLMSNTNRVYIDDVLAIREAEIRLRCQTFESASFVCPIAVAELELTKVQVARKQLKGDVVNNKRRRR